MHRDPVAQPSDLEFADPVIEGRLRADQTSRKARESFMTRSAVLPFLIHGDAAFPGQGVVAGDAQPCRRSQGYKHRRHAAR